MILRISGLSLHTVRINPRKNCAPVFSIANHQEFCNIFSTNYWVGCAKKLNSAQLKYKGLYLYHLKRMIAGLKGKCQI